MLDLPTGTTGPLAREGRGTPIVIAGQLRDGAGSPIADAMLETWQADAGGCYRHPADPRRAQADPAFFGYRRVATDLDGRFIIETVKPGAVPAPDGQLQAPHLLMAVFGGGILTRHVTRLYFEDEAIRNAGDPILRRVPAHRRGTLLARRYRPDEPYAFDIVLQGEGETVFFDL